MNPTRVSLLFGGPSEESVLSIRSATSLYTELERLGLAVNPVWIDRNLGWHVIRSPGLKTPQMFERPGGPDWIPVSENNRVSRLKESDVLFPSIHGTWGEDGTLQAYLETHQVPYVGSGSKASRLAMDKLESKRLARMEQISITEYLFINLEKESISDSAAQVAGSLRFPIFLKPRCQGSSLGVIRVPDKTSLEANLEKIFGLFGGEVLAEEAVLNCKELECSVIEKGPTDLVVGPPGSFNHSSDFTDQNVKFEMLAVGEVPAKVSLVISTKVMTLARTIFKIFGMRDLARVDFFFDEQSEQIYFNEVNSLPSFRATSGFASTLQLTGLEYSEVLETVLQNAYDRR